MYARITFEGKVPNFCAVTDQDDWQLFGYRAYIQLCVGSGDAKRVSLVIERHSLEPTLPTRAQQLPKRCDPDYNSNPGMDPADDPDYFR